jgi:hypothetical protein
VAKGGGRKRVEVQTESVTTKFPAGLHAEMVSLIDREKRWFDRQEFIKEAVREKIERSRAAKAGPAPPPPVRVGL